MANTTQFHIEITITCDRYPERVTVWTERETESNAAHARYDGALAFLRATEKNLRVHKAVLIVTTEIDL